MFAIIGGTVIYGLALYGLYHLTHRKETEGAGPLPPA